MCAKPLVVPGSSTMAQMKGIDVLGKNMRGNKFHVYVGGRYSEKISHLSTKLAKSSSNVCVLSH